MASLRLAAVDSRPDASGSTVVGVRCPTCGHLDDKVIDSRMAEDGDTIRRRRQCLSCEARFTTFERLEARELVVRKRSGDTVAFDRSKIEAGILSAAKGRPITPDEAGAMADAIEERLRPLGPEVTSEQIGFAVLDGLREVDDVAYMRFASVYKDFDDAADFQRELTLLTKRTEPKRH